MIHQRNDSHKLQAPLAETEHEAPRWGLVHAVTGRGGGPRDVFWSSLLAYVGDEGWMEMARAGIGMGNQQAF